MVLLYFSLIILSLNAFAAGRFDTKQPVLQPIIPRERGLTLEMTTCGGWASYLCKTKCGKTIPGNTDLRARLAWTDEFDAHEEWDASEDRPMAIPEAEPMALNISERFFAQSLVSTAFWSDKRDACLAAVERYSEVFKGRQPVHDQTQIFLERTFSNIARYYNIMIFDRVKYWYAQDMARRIKDGIERGCPSISYEGLRGDPCYSPPSDMRITIP